MPAQIHEVFTNVDPNEGVNEHHDEVVATVGSMAVAEEHAQLLNAHEGGYNTNTSYGEDVDGFTQRKFVAHEVQDNQEAPKV